MSPRRQWPKSCVAAYTVHGRPSTVVSSKDCPTVKETWVVRTLVEVWMLRVSPSWLISTEGLDAAATAIFLTKTLTPEQRGTMGKTLWVIPGITDQVIKSLGLNINILHILYYYDILNILFIFVGEASLGIFKIQLNEGKIILNGM